MPFSNVLRGQSKKFSGGRPPDPHFYFLSPAALPETLKPMLKGDPVLPGVFASYIYTQKYISVVFLKLFQRDRENAVL